MSKHHSISSYDKNLCLKPNFDIWLILLFILRPYLVLVLSVVNRKDRFGLIELVYPDRLAMSIGALAGVPAAFLVYAWIKRKPGASRFVRNVWGKGRMLLAVSALLGACGAFVPFWLGTVHAILPGDWLQFAISLLIVVVVYKSIYIRDCFDDFPSDEVADKK